MHFLVIMGSPHKGTTYRACEELRHSIGQKISIDFEYIWLNNANLHPCSGCCLCFTRGEDSCPYHDDAIQIKEKMEIADAIIFASPVYALNVSGQMKVFIDRFSYNFHRPCFFHKKAIILTTTAVLGHKEVLKYLELVARIWGFEITGKVGLITPDPLPTYRKEKNQKIIEKTTKNFLISLKREYQKSPTLKDIIIFHGQRASFKQLKNISPFDYHYWKEKEWFDNGTKYYTDVPVNPFYHGIGLLIEWITTRRVQKDLLEDKGELP